ncbi:MAG: hypothetical protein A2Y10_06150 [Planctomycetes bacterium GWF2_41_51]|nr:MAG: hypothetical protein A2Y10_06150 [Planctomycetes bacterium GWF2_41_51]HBG26468.1 hypothetical protein [Phycisphaerales bacterium]
MRLQKMCIGWSFVFILLMQCCVLAVEDANSLYQQGRALEREKRFSDALTFYQRVIAEYPDSRYAGPDYAGYKAKHVFCRIVLEKGEIALAKEIVKQIENLAPLPKRKPHQLYWTGKLFDDKQFDSDALVLYKRILTDYPDSRYAGPDYADYRAKYISCRMALENGDIALAKELAKQIKNLTSSPVQKPSQLYWTGKLLFDTKKLDTDALLFFEQVIASYPNSKYADPNHAGFRAKYVSCRQALEKDDIASAKGLAEQIKNLASSQEQKSGQLYWTGRLFEGKALKSFDGGGSTATAMFDTSESFYRKIIQDNASGDHYQMAAIRLDVLAALRTLNNGDISTAKAAINTIKTKYANSEYLHGALYVIAEGYYLTGLSNNQKEFFQESISMFENDVLAITTCKASTYYMLGLNYQQLKDYAKAAEAFEKSYQTEPKFKYADYCLFAAGDCNLRMADLGQIELLAGQQKAKVFFGQLESEFPQSNYLVSVLKNDVRINSK